MEKVYLASPFFHKFERNTMKRILKVLRASGYEVFAPFEMTIDGAWNMPNHEWGEKVFCADMDHLKDADIVLAVNYGLYSDTGTAFEIGFAYSLSKTIFTVNFEGATDSLMIDNAVNGMINAEYFRKHDFINLEDFWDKRIYNEQK